LATKQLTQHNIPEDTTPYIQNCSAGEAIVWRINKYPLLEPV